MRDRACVEVEVRHGRRLIGVALVEIDGDAGERRSPKSRPGMMSSLGQPPSPTKGVAIRQMAAMSLNS